MSAGRMTEEHYVERLSTLLEAIRAEAAPNDDETVLFERYQDAEFDLTVEFRLGADFPPQRREALRAVHKRARQSMEELKKRFLAGGIPKPEFAAAMQAAAEAAANDYATVLTAQEMTALFGDDPNAFRLPLMPEAL